MHEEGAVLGDGDVLTITPPRAEVSTLNGDGRDVLGTAGVAPGGVDAPCETRDVLQSRGVLEFGLVRPVSQEEVWCGTVALADWALVAPETGGMSPTNQVTLGGRRRRQRGKRSGQRSKGPMRNGLAITGCATVGGWNDRTINECGACRSIELRIVA